MPAMTASAVPMLTACDFMLFLRCARSLSAPFGAYPSASLVHDGNGTRPDPSGCQFISSVIGAAPLSSRLDLSAPVESYYFLLP